jgi:Cu-Zn family superoxide dismutase
MKRAPLLLSLSFAALLAGCTTTAAGDAAATAAAAPTAMAILLAGDGSARGSAVLTEASDGLHVLVKGSGLVPGIHAVHVHMTGTCTPPDFTSAGGHWNPMGRQHGKDNPAGMHMGDMPNMSVGTDGMGEVEYVIPGGTISSGTTPLLDADGAAVVIHAAPDDNKTDPTGNAGGRVACGAINLS